MVVIYLYVSISRTMRMIEVEIRQEGKDTWVRWPQMQQRWLWRRHGPVYWADGWHKLPHNHFEEFEVEGAEGYYFFIDNNEKEGVFCRSRYAS